MAIILVGGLEIEDSDWLYQQVEARASLRIVHRASQLLEALQNPDLACVVVSDSLEGLVLGELLRNRPDQLPILYHSRTGVTALGLKWLPLPLDREELERSVRQHLYAKFSGEDSLRHLWGRFRHKTMAQVGKIEEAVLALLEEGLDADGAASGAKAAHQLAGSVGSFGYMTGSQLARELERALSSAATLSPAQAGSLAEVVVALRSELERGPTRLNVQAESAPTQTRILLVSKDASLGERLSLEASRQNLSIQLAFDRVEANPVLDHMAPALVAVDLVDEVSNQTFLESLRDSHPSVPVFVFPAEDSFEARLRAARAGVVGYLDRRTSPTALIGQLVSRLEQHNSSKKSKILVVDDDLVVLNVLRRMLRSAGHEVRLLDDPRRFWDVLLEEIPDLVLLDVEMQDYSGIDLCRVMRSDPRWSSMPIIILTGTEKVSVLQEVFASGADDFVRKPPGPELLVRIQNRISRFRDLRARNQLDPLQGIAGRQASLEALAPLLRLAERQKLSLGLALVRPDETDIARSMRWLGESLQSNLQSGDLLIRWSESNYALALFGRTREELIESLSDLLESQRTHSDARTFRAAAASFPADGRDLNALFGLLERTLEEARRNEILSVASRSRTDGAYSHDVLLVEDDPGLAEFTREALETRGLRTTWLPHGRAAVEALISTPPALSPRVVLLDVNMPELDGFGVLDVLREQGLLKRTRVVMLTARSDENHVLEATERGAFDYVSKPYSMSVLL